MELDPALRSRQLGLYQLGVVVAGIVHKQMDQPLARIHRLDRHQQHDRAHGIHRRRLDHAGFSGLEINRTVNVQTLPAAGLRHRKRRVWISGIRTRCAQMAGLEPISAPEAAKTAGFS